MGPVYGQPPRHPVVPEGNHDPDLIAEYTCQTLFCFLAANEPEVAVYHFVGIHKHLEHVMATTVEQVPLNTAVLHPCGWSVQIYT